jgi:hypothetical protein
VLYELFTGRRPFDGTTLKKLLEQQEAAQLTSMISLATDIDPSVEPAIRRCLDPDPAKRPANAISVAAALPGGDPLAAALAAGETPSPELVAAAGETEGLPLKFSVPCLAAIVLCLFAVSWVHQRGNALMQAPMDYPPQVLEQKGRDMASLFGYARKPADTAIELSNRDDLLDYLKKLPEPRKWSEWLAVEDPIAADYRESPKPLYAEPFGEVTKDNPAPLEPGMVSVVEDGNGRLREFSGIPYEGAEALATPVEPAAVLRAAGLDMAAFSETSPTALPRGPTDQLRAWKGPHPVLPGTELTMEIGWWKGRITFVKVLAPWDTAAEGSSALSLQRFVLYALMVGIIFALLLARRNWRLRRADRQGALRIAAVSFLLSGIAWIGTVHAIPETRILFLLFQSIGQWALSAGLLWIVYLAMEPELRAGWPHSVVTWNRLLAGRWKDAQVAADVLIGGAIGAAVWIATDVVDLVVGKTPPGSVAGLASLLGTRQWIAGSANILSNLLLTGFALFLTVFGLRRLVKRNVPAALLAAAVMVLVNNPAELVAHWQVLVPIYFCMFAVLIFVLLRRGLVALFSMIFFVNSCGTAMVGADWTTWYAPYGLASLALLLAVALFAFWRSLGSRELLGAGTPV